MSDERVSGYPQPQLYDQHYINKYAYPKGLKCAGRRTDIRKNIDYVNLVKALDD